MKCLAEQAIAEYIEGKLDAAEIRREHARSEHARVGSRARAVQLLRTVMVRRPF